MNTLHSAATDGRKASLAVKVTDRGGFNAVVAGASIALHKLSGHFDASAFDATRVPPDAVALHVCRTDPQGKVVFKGLDEAVYVVAYLHLPLTTLWIKLHAGCHETVCLEPQIDASVETVLHSDDCKRIDCRSAQQGEVAVSTLRHAARLNETIVAPPGSVRLPSAAVSSAEYSTTLSSVGRINLAWALRFPPLDSAVSSGAGLTSAADPAAGTAGSFAELSVGNAVDVRTKPPVRISGNVGVSLARSGTEATEDLPLWVAIRNGTEALSFNNYLHFIDQLFCADGREGHASFHAQKDVFRHLKHRRFLPFTDTDAYRMLKAATEAFVMVNCAVLRSPAAFSQDADNGYLDRRDLPGVGNFRAAYDAYLDPPGKGNAGLLPYLALIRRKLPDVPITDIGHDEANLCVGFVQDKLVNPCLVELIWSYWHEEAMLVQTMNAVTRRFQNIRSPSTPDPLANLEIDPLRPLNNLIWGYTQDEQHRLTVNRRNHEYDHHYGLRLRGKAVQGFRPADTRSQFLEAFHHLLRLCTVFYKQDDDTTVKADAFPVLNALKEVHLVMSQGAHNQFGDMPSTARIEMLIQQWLLGRPEFREFLPTRIMVAYPEPWMDRVDAMKKLQGWTDTSVVHFRNLAIFGEQLLLTIRYGAWSEVYEPTQAFNWARFWRPQIQGYNHAYRAATGIDLGSGTGDTSADATLPGLLLQKRLALQQRSA